MQLIITDEQPANDMRLSDFMALAVNFVSSAAVSMSPLMCESLDLIKTPLQPITDERNTVHCQHILFGSHDLL